MVSNSNLLFQVVIFRFHVKVWECTPWKFGRNKKIPGTRVNESSELGNLKMEKIGRRLSRCLLERLGLVFRGLACCYLEDHPT